MAMLQPVEREEFDDDLSDSSLCIDLTGTDPKSVKLRQKQKQRKIEKVVPRAARVGTKRKRGKADTGYQADSVDSQGNPAPVDIVRRQLPADLRPPRVLSPAAECRGALRSMANEALQQARRVHGTLNAWVRIRSNQEDTHTLSILDAVIERFETSSVKLFLNHTAMLLSALVGRARLRTTDTHLVCAIVDACLLRSIAYSGLLIVVETPMATEQSADSIRSLRLVQMSAETSLVMACDSLVQFFAGQDLSSSKVVRSAAGESSTSKFSHSSDRAPETFEDALPRHGSGSQQRDASTVQQAPRKELNGGQSAEHSLSRTTPAGVDGRTARRSSSVPGHAQPEPNLGGPRTGEPLAHEEHANSNLSRSAVRKQFDSMASKAASAADRIAIMLEKARTIPAVHLKLSRAVAQQKVEESFGYVGRKQKRLHQLRSSISDLEKRLKLQRSAPRTSWNQQQLAQTQQQLQIAQQQIGTMQQSLKRVQELHSLDVEDANKCMAKMAWLMSDGSVAWMLSAAVAQSFNLQPIDAVLCKLLSLQVDVDGQQFRPFLVEAVQGLAWTKQTSKVGSLSHVSLIQVARLLLSPPQVGLVRCCRRQIPTSPHFRMVLNQLGLASHTMSNLERLAALLEQDARSPLHGRQHTDLIELEQKVKWDMAAQLASSSLASVSRGEFKGAGDEGPGSDAAPATTAGSLQDASDGGASDLSHRIAQSGTPAPGSRKFSSVPTVTSSSSMRLGSNETATSRLASSAPFETYSTSLTAAAGQQRRVVAVVPIKASTFEAGGGAQWRDDSKIRRTDSSVPGAVLSSQKERPRGQQATSLAQSAVSPSSSGERGVLMVPTVGLSPSRFAKKHRPGRSQSALLEEAARGLAMIRRRADEEEIKRREKSLQTRARGLQWRAARLEELIAGGLNPVVVEDLSDGSVGLLEDLEDN